MPRDVGVVVVAAGHGIRAGDGVPKQFRMIAGVPMLLRALRPFENHPDVRQIVLVLPEADLAAPPPFLSLAQLSSLKIVGGGDQRDDSVRRGLESLEQECSVVLVHDAARPFPSSTVIGQVIEIARGGEGAIAAIRVTDTLKAVNEESGIVERTLPREGVWRAQTPQGFPRQVLSDAHARAAREGRRASDDASLVEALGVVVRAVVDSARNFKVTTADDFALAESIARGEG